MSTLKQDVMEQYSQMDLDPLAGLHRPSSDGSSFFQGNAAITQKPFSRTEFGEQLGDLEQSGD